MFEAIKQFFAKAMQNTIALKAGYICSNPDCQKNTLVPSPIDSNEMVYHGHGVMIYSPVQDHPRNSTEISAEHIGSSHNGLFLCFGCAYEVESDQEGKFTVEMLLDWQGESK